MEPGERTLLVVESDAEARRLMATWLMDAGYTVLTCPGPLGPDYECLGTRGKACPLANGADIVVLDLRLESDIVMEGAPGWQLLVYYMENGQRVVALSSGEDAVQPRSDKGVIVLQRPVIRPVLLEAVRAHVRDLAKAS